MNHIWIETANSEIISLQHNNRTRLKWKHLLQDTWFSTVVKSQFLLLPHYWRRFLYHYQSPCCMLTNYAASPQITLWASLESDLSVLIWRIHQRLCSFCAAEEELECVDTEGPVVCWESLGLPDLDCDEKPGWISNSSLAGELIQPGPQEVWTQPTHKHAVLQLEGWWKAGQRLNRGNVHGGKAAMGQSETLHVDETWKQNCWWTVLNRASWRKRATTREWKQSQMEGNTKRKDWNCIPLEGRLS